MENGGSVTAIVDDNYAMGLPKHIFSAHQTFGTDLVKLGLQLQPTKSQCYITEAFRNDEWDRHGGDISNGVLKDADGKTVIAGGTPTMASEHAISPFGPNSSSKATSH